MGPGAECAAQPEAFDYGGYLRFLKEHGHNFIRLWRWEQFKSQAAGGAFHLCMAPQPWLRTRGVVLPGLPLIHARRTTFSSVVPNPIAHEFQPSPDFHLVVVSASRFRPATATSR